MTKQREAMRFARELRREGWTVEQTNSHYKLTHPKFPNERLTMSESPSCRHWKNQVKRDIARLEKKYGKITQD